MADKTVSGLHKLLADVYVLYFKTHSMHWNVTGPDFAAVHAMLEQHYLKFFALTDEIAERMRALGGVAPHNLAQLISKGALKEENAVVSKVGDIVKILIKDFEALGAEVKNLNSVIDAKDMVTADLLVGIEAYLEKNLWMLKSSL